MRVLNFFLSLLVALAATGCAITPPVSYTPDGMVQVAQVTTTPAVDGTAVTTANICLLAVSQPDVNKRTVVSDPTQCVGGPKIMQYANTPTAAGVITNTIPVAVGQIIQGEYAKSVVRQNGRVCKDGGCAPGTVVQNNNLVNTETISGAVSGSVADVKVDANIGGRLPCATTNSCGTAGK